MSRSGSKEARRPARSKASAQAARETSVVVCSSVKRAIPAGVPTGYPKRSFGVPSGSGGPETFVRAIFSSGSSTKRAHTPPARQVSGPSYGSTRRTPPGSRCRAIAAVAARSASSLRT